MKKFVKILLGIGVATSLLTTLYVVESKKVEVSQNYNFKDNWICYQKQEKVMNIMHLSFSNDSIIEGTQKTKEYTIKEDTKNYFEYDLVIDNKKYAHIIEIRNDKIEYKKYTEKEPYICKRSSSFEAIEDFTGKWVGHINYLKDDIKTPDEKIESKIILTLYKDGLYITGENLPDDYYYQKIDGSKQEDSKLKIKLAGFKKDLPMLKFKIINNKEIILLPTKDFNQKETYLKRIDRF